MDLIKRFFPMQQQSFFLFGPRGTGKSTLMHTTYPHALSIDLLDPQLLRTLSARPESLSDIIAGNSTVGVVIIDEIQKIPALLSVVHALIELDILPRLKP